MKICRVFLHVGIVTTVQVLSGFVSLAQEESRSVGKDQGQTKSAEQQSTGEPNPPQTIAGAAPIPTYKELASSLIVARAQFDKTATRLARLKQQNLAGKVSDEEVIEAQRELNAARRYYQVCLEEYAATMAEIKRQLTTAQAGLDAARKFHELCNAQSKQGIVEAKTAIEAQLQFEKATVTLERLETRNTLYKRIGERLGDVREFDGPSIEVPGWGLLLASLPSNERGELGKSKYRGGMRIAGVHAESLAAANGIQKGDILVGLDKWETMSAENVSWVIRQIDVENGRDNKRDKVKFYVIRAQETKFGFLPMVPAEQLLPKVAGVPND